MFLPAFGQGSAVPGHTLSCRGLPSTAYWNAALTTDAQGRARWRPALLLGLVVCGVPVLGWLTYLTGPAFGLLFLALGLSLLVWPPAQYLRRRRHAQPERGWH